MIKPIYQGVHITYFRGNMNILAKGHWGKPSPAIFLNYFPLLDLQWPVARISNKILTTEWINKLLTNQILDLDPIWQVIC